MDSYEPLSPENLVNPYPAYEWLRSLPGLYWHEGMQSYVASRYVDCKKVLSDNRYFAKDRRRIGQDIPPERMSIQTEDPPNRLGLRQDFRKSIHSLDLSSICEESGERFESRLLSHTGKFDFVEEVSRISALDMTSSIFGLSEEQVNDYFKLNLDLTRGLDAGLDPARLERGIQAGKALQKYADSWLEQEGVEALLKSAKYLSNFYPKDYTVRTFAGMVNAAFGTASSLTSGLFLELAKDTRLVDEAGQSLSRGEGKLSVNEFIRYISPAQATNRVVVNSCEISGTKLQKGDTVVTLIASANRDENIFERPNQIIPGRKNNRHLAFAAGPHLCLGRRLAEAWGQEVIKRLVNNMDKFSVDIDSILYADSATARSLSKLPVERIV